MNLVFLSNYFNHHQQPLSDALAKRVNFTFLATREITQERQAMGWGMEPEPEYVCHADREPQRAKKCLEEADAVIVGTAPASLVRRCIRRGQVVFRYAERPLKNGSEWKKFLPRLVKWQMQNPPGKPVYMLCASAYTAGDYAKFGLFRGKTFRFGYFPEVKRYDSVAAIQDAKKKSSILWAGRFLDWKHPDEAVLVAERLRAEGAAFEMTLIGTGPMERTLRERIIQKGLESWVHLPGPMKPQEVRRCMEESQIYLVTSDRREGWGAVLNESMNSGCAVVASDAIGAVPFLLRDGENGCVYHSGNVDELYEKVRSLLSAPEQARKLGAAAYEAMITSWNAETAAERFLCLAEHALNGETLTDAYTEGPCSPAPIIREDWYKG